MNRPERLLVALLSSTLLTCTESGTMLQLVATLLPETSTCTFGPANPQSFRGAYDPTGSPNFALGVVAVNNLEGPKEGGYVDETDTPAKPSGNDITVLGFDVCWFLLDEQPAARQYGSHDGGFAVRCDDLPSSRKRFIAGPGQVRANDELHALAVAVLSHDDLRSVFGPSFDPAALADIDRGEFAYDWDRDGNFDPTVGLDDAYDAAYSFQRSDPVPYDAATGTPQPNRACSGGVIAGRDVAWGCYPTRRTAEIVLQFRAVGQLLTGAGVHSNWFSFPVELCVGCRTGSCGLLKQVQCPDTPLCRTKDNDQTDCTFRCPRYKPIGSPTGIDGQLCDPNVLAAQCVDPLNVIDNDGDGAADVNLACPTSRKCPDGGSCVPRHNGWIGLAPDFDAGLCRPFNYFSDGDCVDFTSCPQP